MFGHKPQPVTRRDALRRIGGGFAMMSFAGLVGESIARADVGATAGNPWMIKDPHFKPKAKHVIFLFMNGGVSHIDSFDPKPMLTKYNGQPMPGGDLKHERKTGSLMKSPFEFKKVRQERDGLFGDLAEARRVRRRYLPGSLGLYRDSKP